MPGVGVAPGGPMGAENIRDLQRGTRHGSRGLCWRRLLSETLERARNVADRLEGDAGIARRRIELLVPEQNLNQANIGLALEQMGGEAMPQRMHRNALVDPGSLRRGMAGPVELAHRETLQ